jgi:hypothetical protein
MSKFLERKVNGYTDAEQMDGVVGLVDHRYASIPKRRQNGGQQLEPGGFQKVFSVRC